MLSQQLPGEPGLASQNSTLQTQDSTVPASVVIQPISGLSLQPTVTSASLTIGPLSEQDPVMTTSSGKWQPGVQLLACGHAFAFRAPWLPSPLLTKLSKHVECPQHTRTSPLLSDVHSVYAHPFPPTRNSRGPVAFLFLRRLVFPDEGILHVVDVFF